AHSKRAANHDPSRRPRLSHRESGPVQRTAPQLSGRSPAAAPALGLTLRIADFRLQIADWKKDNAPISNLQSAISNHKSQTCLDGMTRYAGRLGTLLFPSTRRVWQVLKMLSLARLVERSVSERFPEALHVTGGRDICAGRRESP